MPFQVIILFFFLPLRLSLFFLSSYSLYLSFSLPPHNRYFEIERNILPRKLLIAMRLYALTEQEFSAEFSKDDATTVVSKLRQPLNVANELKVYDILTALCNIEFMRYKGTIEVRLPQHMTYHYYNRLLCCYTLQGTVIVKQQHLSHTSPYHARHIGGQ